MPIGSNQGLWSTPVLGGLLTLLVVVILARVGGRLLGVRLGWGRALVAGWLGLILGIITVWAVTGRRVHGPRNLPWLPVLFSALIATMLIAVLLELLAKPGRFAAMEDRLRHSPIPHPWRALRQRLTRTRRYVTVSRIAARHGLSAYLSGRRPARAETRPLARNARHALEEAGGMFVKLGQVLSTRADLLPPDVIAELSGLQDHVPAGLTNCVLVVESKKPNEYRESRSLLDDSHSQSSMLLLLLLITRIAWSEGCDAIISYISYNMPALPLRRLAVVRAPSCPLP